MRLISEKQARTMVAVIILLLFTALQAKAQATATATKKTREVIVSLLDRKLALLEDGVVVKSYEVAVGAEVSPSPVGDFSIVNRLENPGYFGKGQVIPAGKKNPLGTRWMGLSIKSFGIHGTNQPDSIGKAASSGCIRMRKADLEELFTLLKVGDKVSLRGERDEQVAAIFPSAGNPMVVASATPQQSEAKSYAMAAR